MKKISYDDKEVIAFFVASILINHFDIWTERWQELLYRAVLFIVITYYAWVYYKYKNKPIRQWEWYNKLWLVVLIIAILSIPVSTVMELLGMSTKLF